jgi:UDP-N-acetyl-D-mannosaminuronate dehydrogenase
MKGALEEVEVTLHVIFSTDCSPYQDWQTLVVFHSTTTVGTCDKNCQWLCDDQKKTVLKGIIPKLYPKYHVHLLRFRERC